MFTNIGMIDKIVVNSNGAYTHDDAFKLGLSFAYGLLLMYYERDLYQDRAASAREGLRESNKPRR